MISAYRGCAGCGGVWQARRTQVTLYPARCSARHTPCPAVPVAPKSKMLGVGLTLAPVKESPTGLLKELCSHFFPGLRAILDWHDHIVPNGIGTIGPKHFAAQSHRAALKFGKPGNGCFTRAI